MAYAVLYKYGNIKAKCGRSCYRLRRTIFPFPRRDSPPEQLHRLEYRRYTKYFNASRVGIPVKVKIIAPRSPNKTNSEKIPESRIQLLILSRRPKISAATSSVITDLTMKEVISPTLELFPMSAVRDLLKHPRHFRLQAQAIVQIIATRRTLPPGLNATCGSR